MPYFVYILASRKNGTLYIGVTNGIKRKIFEHRNDLVEGFTKKYQVHDLVFFEQGESIEGTILKEKQMKAWKREWKINLKQSPILNGGIYSKTFDVDSSLRWNDM